MKKIYFILVAVLFFCMGTSARANDPALNLNNYSFDNPSQITFKAYAFMHDFQGITRDVSGKFELDLSQLNQPGRGAVEINAASLKTKNIKRDKLMREEHLLTKKYPLIRFVITDAKLDSDDSIQKKADYVLNGEMELHGVRRNIRFIATLDYSRPDALKIVGGFPVKMSDYNIPVPAFSKIFKMKNEVKVSLDLTAVPNS